MWRRLYNRKGQSTGEYALIFAIVLGAIVAMQTYVKKELQGRIKDGADYMTRQTTDLGMTSQYDPYYFSSQYITAKTSAVTRSYDTGESTTEIEEATPEKTTRESGGYTEHTAAEDQGVEK